MNKIILTVSLNPALDKTIQIKNFQVGRDLRPNLVDINAGGKGLNVARVLTSLGSPCCATGLLGGLSGDKLRGILKQEGLRHKFVSIKNSTRSNLTILDKSQGMMTRILEGGPHVSQMESHNFLKLFRSLLPRCSWVIFSGSVPPGMNESSYKYFIAESKKNGIRTVLDSSQSPLRIGIKAKPLIVKPNLEEAEQFLGYRLSSLVRIKRAVKDIYLHGCQMAIISMGKEGAVAYNGHILVHVVGPEMKARNTVGSGDCFVGGLVHSLHSGNSFIKSLRLAVACGAANAVNIHPNKIYLNDIRTIMQKVRVRVFSEGARLCTN
jgi:1-phosphofructokinase family hexose kinase